MFYCTAGNANVENQVLNGAPIGGVQVAAPEVTTVVQVEAPRSSYAGIAGMAGLPASIVIGRLCARRSDQVLCSLPRGQLLPSTGSGHSFPLLSIQRTLIHGSVDCAG